jgi:hypothetical protein
MNIEEENEYDGWCHAEQRFYSLDELGGDAWLTGCPCCGINCWEIDYNYDVEDYESQ